MPKCVYIITCLHIPLCPPLVRLCVLLLLLSLLLLHPTLPPRQVARIPCPIWAPVGPPLRRRRRLIGLPRPQGLMEFLGRASNPIIHCTSITHHHTMGLDLEGLMRPLQGWWDQGFCPSCQRREAWEHRECGGQAHYTLDLSMLWSFLVAMKVKINYLSFSPNFFPLFLLPCYKNIYLFILKTFDFRFTCHIISSFLVIKECAILDS